MAGGAGATEDDQSFEAAHRAMLEDKSLQFEPASFEPPEPPDLDWLQPIADFFAFIAPILPWIFWGGVALIVGFLLYSLFLRLSEIRGFRRTSEVPQSPAPTPLFRPAPTRARALLEEADRLAAEGRYGEAARILLHRSIEDVESAHPGSIAISMTSREIARVSVLSEKGRNVFSGIAQAVETSLFGGRPLGAEQYTVCRQSYAGFAFGAAA